MIDQQILDDFEKIKLIDSRNMQKILKNFPESCREAIEKAECQLSSEFMKSKFKKPEKIIISGMGGSAIAGTLLKYWLRNNFEIPIEVCRDYSIPAYANPKTLVIAISYSGNTEETVSSYLNALEKKCMVVTISSGGLLKEFSDIFNTPIVTLTKGIPPRCAIPQIFFSSIMILMRLKVLKNVEKEVLETISVLNRVKDKIQPETETKNNFAKKLAIGIKDTIPAIYGHGLYSGVALRIKTQFNENSKIPAKYELFPELSHNEIVGWTDRNEFTKTFSVILIRDKYESEDIKKRIDITKNIILNKSVKGVFEIFAEGISDLARMFSVTYIGDFTSFYLAVLYNIDPTPVIAIDKIKNYLLKHTNKVEELRKRMERIKSSF
jgi:glucose/mannose-6-phosphate isomerase